MSDYQEEIEKMRLYVKRLGKPLPATPRQKRTFTPYAERIRKMNVSLNPANSNEQHLLQCLDSEDNVSALIKALLKDYYNI